MDDTRHVANNNSKIFLPFSVMYKTDVVNLFIYVWYNPPASKKNLFFSSSLSLLWWLIKLPFHPASHVCVAAACRMLQGLRQTRKRFICGSICGSNNQTWQWNLQLCLRDRSGSKTFGRRWPAKVRLKVHLKVRLWVKKVRLWVRSAAWWRSLPKKSNFANWISLINRCFALNVIECLQCLQTFRLCQKTSSDIRRQLHMSENVFECLICQNKFPTLNINLVAMP